MKKILIILILTIVFLSGCMEVKYEEGKTQTVEKQEVLKILDHNLVREGNEFFTTVKVKGTAQNIGTKQLSYAEVRVKFYDKNGNLIDSSLDNINDLAPNEKWNFEVMYFGNDAEKIDNYKIAIGSSLEAF